MTTQFGRELHAALSLAERAALAGRPAAAGAAAHQRLERWRSQSPFDREDFLARRLVQTGLDEARLDEEGFAALLGEPLESLAARVADTPEWVRDLEEAFRLADPGYSLPFSPEQLRGAETRFLWLAAPLIQQAERRIAQAAAELAACGPAQLFDPAATVPLLLADLPNQLLWTITRVGVLELNIARLEERISGSTPEERFDSFIELLRRPGEAQAILERYPVLARQLVLRARNWADASIELLQRLSADWDAIRAALGPVEEPGTLVEVLTGAGDRHRGNRTVSLLTFA